MLNITNNSIASRVDKLKYSSLNKVEQKNSPKILIPIVKWSVILLVIIAILPWTQNVRSNGNITTLKPDQRPQDIQSVIAGRIEEWKVQEGDLVQKGDTIVIISEVKDAYFDEDLLKRTQNQVDLKKQSIQSYEQKIDAQDNQITALKSQRSLESGQLDIKIEQTKLKVQNDSIKYQVALIDNSIAIYQLERMDSLYQQGYKSLADLEARRMKAQQTNSSVISAKNNWDNGKNELNRLKMERLNIQSKFDNSVSKTMSDKFTTETNKYDSETDVNKLENQFRNYEVRRGMYVITAPQDGYITKLMVQGIGETIKEGDALLTFMPKDHELAVEIFIDPIDLPLMNIGEHVRLQFDGWPAIVFSGWPGASYGTYGGTIYAIDKMISSNGKYRILVKPDVKDHEWPEALRVGSGSKAMILLNDVPIWYEVWRKINDFPPTFYQPEKNTSK